MQSYPIQSTMDAIKNEPYDTKLVSPNLLAHYIHPPCNLLKLF